MIAQKQNATWHKFPSDARGVANHGWLRSRHTFSFGSYYNPDVMGFSALRVINDDRVDAGAGFPRHPHRDMEILTYVLDGALEHKDSMGTGSIIRPGDIQLMSAGSGVTHSEYNANDDAPVHFLQIWLMPNEQGGKPRYQQARIDEKTRDGAFVDLVNLEGEAGALQIRSDSRVLSARLRDGQSMAHKTPSGRAGWLHVARGELDVDSTSFTAGDALYFDDSVELALKGRADTELLLFDLAA